MAAHEGMDLRRFAREHHVHYDVRSDAASGATGGRTHDYEVRLFASHDGPPLSTPTCERCHALRQDLRTFAQHLETVSAAAPPQAVELRPDPAALYTAKDDPRRDEVVLTIRLVAPEGEAEALASRLQHDLTAAGVERQA